MPVPRVLLTNLYLRGCSGTETHTRDLALELSRRQVSVAVFSPAEPGPIAAELARSSIPVVRDPRDCPFDVDLIHGHHNFALALALAAHPKARALFVCHDAVAWHDRAPRFANVLRWYAVDELCRQRVAADLNAPVDSICIVGNGVDLKRFRPRQELPRRPLRALIFNHRASESNYAPIVREVCRQRGLELVVLGAHSRNVSTNPEHELPKYDIVFGKGRCAMEAMACGCAVVLCGVEGMGPLVEVDQFESLRRWNFGRKTLTRAHSARLISESLDAYCPDRVAQLTDLARASLSLEGIGNRWEAEYRQLMTLPLPSPNEDAWVEELQYVYQRLDRLHHLEYQLRCKNTAPPADRNREPRTIEGGERD